MKKISSTVRLTFSLVLMTISVLLIASAFQLIPNERNILTRERASFCEAIAINFSLHATRNDPSAIETSLKLIASRNPEIQSVAIRRTTGETVVQVGDHAKHWVPLDESQSTDTHIEVPIADGTEPWGTVEFAFESLQSPGLIGWLQMPMVKLMGYVSIAATLAYYFFLKRVLRQLNPSKVIPNRVRTALDTLAEGLLILDAKERITLANSALCKKLGRTPDSLVGLDAAELSWRNQGQAEQDVLDTVPWREALQSGESHTGTMIDLIINDEGERRTFLVSSAPIINDKQSIQGVLTSLEDVTPLEKKKHELNRALRQLTESSDEIRRQNQELEKLATTDPLTECLNRRSFFVQFETLWQNSVRHELPISCIMVDIDFFKSINDDHGHSVGDDVLRGISATLRRVARKGDLVCRFGGEEFCVLLPHTDVAEASEAAERFRVAIAETEFPQLSVTASLGVSARSLGGATPQEMVDQADRCLYVAKRNGRNQYVRWDNVPDDLEIDESKISRTRSVADDGAIEETIPYRAVAALVSALAYRHSKTAEHCRRVADLCVNAAEGLLPPATIYTLEIGAMLHDIGKIGVPDSILHKAGTLTDEERKVMKQQDRIGLEIVRESFGNDALTEIIATYKVKQNEEVEGQRPSVAARLLTIADAFDSMTQDTAYRSAKSRQEAFEELRRCAGSQFDEELVERFIASTSNRQLSPGSSEETGPVSRAAALQIGLQIESLVRAIGTQDLSGLGTLAQRLADMAAENGVEDVSKHAADLSNAVATDADLLDILASANKLIGTCRATQNAWVMKSVS